MVDDQHVVWRCTSRLGASTSNGKVKPPSDRIKEKTDEEQQLLVMIEDHSTPTKKEKATDDGLVERCIFAINVSLGSLILGLVNLLLASILLYALRPIRCCFELV